MTLPARTVAYALRGRPEWAGRSIRFRLSRQTYTDDIQVPAYEVVGALDENGDGSVVLFPNDLGTVATVWEVTFPDGSEEEIEVEDGVGALDLSDLLEA